MPKLLRVLIAIIPALLPAAGAADPNAAAQSVVIQVSDDDPRKWHLVLNNAENIQNSIGRDRVVIEIIAYGPGLAMLRLESVVGSRLNDAMAAGVAFKACRNTMRAEGIGERDLFPRVGFVDSGVLAIINRQTQGWSYLRP
jgi:intracellular sulfur oxidation DsrE/DsrF family protein